MKNTTQLETLLKNAKSENCYNNNPNDAVRFLGVFAIFSIIFLLGLTNFSYGETFESI
jgi:hypothetical protein